MADALRVRFLGTGIPYIDGMAVMRAAMADIDRLGPQLLLLEHQDTITITRQHGRTHLLVPEEELRARGIELVETDRGGDITFHGVGQLVGYPVMQLESATPDVGAYVRGLEKALIRTCEEFGVTGCHTVPGMTGVWVGNSKLVAIGVGISKGITRHGFAINVTTELAKFTDCIVPCGLTGRGVTSLAIELTKRAQPVPTYADICGVVTKNLCEIFNKRAASHDMTEPQL